MQAGIGIGIGFEGGLASARDRARLRERQAAERARVERVLARGPRGVERRRVERPAPPSAAPGGAAGPACAVCGGREVVEDEVFAEGILRLGWCRRCDHRWTERRSPRFVPRVRRPEARPPSEPPVAAGARDTFAPCTRASTRRTSCATATSSRPARSAGS